MKNEKLFLMLAAGLLSAVLGGCQTVTSNQQEFQPYMLQFVKGHGIVKSEHPVYVLDSDTELIQTKGDRTLALVDVVQQNRKLIVNFTLTGNSEDERAREIDDNIKLIEPELSENAGRPIEAMYVSDPDFYEQYGYMRSTITAWFELPSDLDIQKHLSDYMIQVLDFDEPIPFTMKQVPCYETLEDLAAAEGGVDTHDGFSVLAVGNEVEEGILVEWYTYSESDQSASISYTPPGKTANRPTLSSGEKEYPTERNLLYMNTLKLYRLEGIVSAGHVYNQLFLVPEEERQGSFSLTIPGITYLQADESEEITLRIPEDKEVLTEKIPFREGSVCLNTITRMTESQEHDIDGAAKRPAVYIEVAATSEEKELSLKSLICKRKAGRGLWENQRYDFDENDNLSGFRVFYNEGDTEIILKFSQSGFYWEQPYRLDLEL